MFGYHPKNTLKKARFEVGCVSLEQENTTASLNSKRNDDLRDQDNYICNVLYKPKIIQKKGTYWPNRSLGNSGGLCELI